jgi:hypothetical protein
MEVAWGNDSPQGEGAARDEGVACGKGGAVCSSYRCGEAWHTQVMRGGARHAQVMERQGLATRCSSRATVGGLV